jgi:hypothetical protein
MVKITNLLNNAIHLLSEGKGLISGKKDLGRHCTHRRVDRVPGFFSSRPSVSPPRNQRRRGTHSPVGVGDPGSDEGTDTVVL